MVKMIKLLNLLTEKIVLVIKPGDVILGGRFKNKKIVVKSIGKYEHGMPTINGRNGMLFTSEGIINIKNKKWEFDYSLIDKNGTTWVDKTYSKSYLRHLFSVNEMLGRQIASIHNLGFYCNLMNEARKMIIKGDFLVWKNKIIKKLNNRL